MTSPDPQGSSPGARDLPEPPYSPELLADLHADALPPDVASHVRSRIVDDVAAQETLASLDRTTALLRSLPVIDAEVPPAVRAATDRTLADIAADVTDRTQRRQHRRVSIVATAASLLIVFAVALTVWHVTRTGAPDTPTVVADTIALDSTEVASALTLVGHVDGPFADAGALRRCTAANGVSPSTPIVGSGEARIRQQTTVVILLATGVAARFDVLLVGRDCDTGNPATIARSTIGG